ISTCCEIGAVSVTNDPEIRTAMRNYGENVGMSFQIQDDVLDYTSRTNILGKPIGNDIKEGKLTLPLIYACTQAPKSEAKNIVSLVKGKNITQKQVDFVQSFVKNHGGIEYATEQALNKVRSATENLERFPDSNIKQSLVNFAHFVVSREK
ncbi:MAG: polyprenyl synthetase family protein, partial [Bacteriodetes bacterium]|nr:polyprenyl synthetase family protein [Bacteroidota bacterium]